MAELQNCKTCAYNQLFPKLINTEYNFAFCTEKKCSRDYPGYSIENNVCDAWTINEDYDIYFDDDDDIAANNF